MVAGRRGRERSKVCLRSSSSRFIPIPPMCRSVLIFAVVKNLLTHLHLDLAWRANVRGIESAKISEPAHTPRAITQGTMGWI